MGQNGKEKRARQALGDKFTDVPLVGEGETETALCDHVSDPDNELQGQGFVQAVAPAKEICLLFGLGFGCAALFDKKGLVAVGIVARGQLNDDETDQGDAQDDGYGDGCTANDESDHKAGSGNRSLCVSPAVRERREERALGPLLTPH